MNKIFKTKRNHLGQSVVCSEIAKSCTKGKLIATALTVAIASVSGTASALTDDDFNKIKDLAENNELYIFGGIDDKDGKEVVGLLPSSIENHSRINNLEDNKVDVDAFVEVSTGIGNKIDEIDNNKADKAQFDQLVEFTDKSVTNLDNAVTDLDNRVTDNKDLLNESIRQANERFQGLDQDIAKKADLETLKAVGTHVNTQINDLENRKVNLSAFIAVTEAVGDKVDEIDKDIVEVVKNVNAVSETADINSINIAKNTDDIVEVVKNVNAVSETADINSINIAKNTDDIADLEEIVATTALLKADKATVLEMAQEANKEFDKLNNSVKTVQNNLASEVNKLDEKKANKADLAKKADKAVVDAKIATNKNALEGVQATLDKKANQSEVTAIKDQVENVVTAVEGQVTQVTNLVNNYGVIDNRIDALQSSYQNLDGKVNKLDKKLSAGVAGAVALAMMPAPNAGQHYITGGAGYYNGEQAAAVGMTGASEDGQYSYKLGGSISSEGGSAVGVGLGYRWK